MPLYYYAYDGEQFGPVEELSLFELYAAKTLSAESLIWTEDFSDWSKLNDTTIGKLIISGKSMADSSSFIQHNSKTKRPMSTRKIEIMNVSDFKVELKSNQMPLDELNTNEVWIEDNENVWVRANVVDFKNGVYVVQHSVNGKIFELKDEKDSIIYRVNPKSSADITSLPYIHEPAILDNVKQRYNSKVPYTFMGAVLLAVNPLQSLPQQEMGMYIQDSNLDSHPSLPPHPYAIAESAYQQLSFSKLNQSIIISGESGSGKTETAKILLKFLVHRTASSRESVVKSSRRLDTRLLESSPVLESFGNAKTSKNDNSSRFGKFMKLLYVKTTSTYRVDEMRIVGASIETYLLEKSRVVYQSVGERNFHIFYGLLAGIEKSHPKIPEKFMSLVKTINLMSVESFRILRHTDDGSTIAGSHGLAYLNELLDAFYTVGFSKDELEHILRILYGILVLGNVSFDQVDSPEGPASTIHDISSVNQFSEIIKVHPDLTQSLLTQRKVQTRGEWFTIRLSQLDATYARDAIAKALYKSLFGYIVDRINSNISVAEMNIAQKISSGSPIIEDYFIGVLDIFGFEQFAVNQFEQLMINFANEAIQNTFNLQVFDSELRLYQSENLDFIVSSIPDNTGCVELIADKSNSILQILDSISRQPKASDERFCEEVHKTFPRSNYFLPVHPKDRKISFVILHYAGGVKYSVNSSEVAGESSWISKNNDSYPDEISTLCTTSGVLLMNQLDLVTNQEYQHTPTSSSNSSRPTTEKLTKKNIVNSLVRPTQSSIFVKSMRELNELLQSTSCQFARCVKPNRHMVVGQFDNLYVVDQLRSLGVLQTCEVLKAGLPTRVTYADLKSSLRSIVEPFEQLFLPYGDSVLLCCLLRAYGVSDDIYRLGRTMVFFKAGQLAFLSKLLHGRNNRDDEIIRRKAEEFLRVIDESLSSMKQSESLADLLTEDISTLKINFQRLIDLWNKHDKSTMGGAVSFDEVTEILASVEKCVLTVNQLIGEISIQLSHINASLETIQGFSKTNKISTTMETLIAQFREHEKVAVYAYSIKSSKLVTEPSPNSSSYSQAMNSVAALQSMHKEASTFSQERFREDIVVISEKMEGIYSSHKKCCDLVRQALDGARKCRIDYASDKNKEFLEVHGSLRVSYTQTMDAIKAAVDSYRSLETNSASQPPNMKTFAKNTLNEVQAVEKDVTVITVTFNGIHSQLSDELKLLESSTSIGRLNTTRISENDTKPSTMPPPKPVRKLSTIKSTADDRSSKLARAEGSSEEDLSVYIKELEALQKEVNRLKSLVAEKGLVSGNTSASGSSHLPSHKGTTQQVISKGRVSMDTAHDLNSLVLPQGWKEVIDKTTNKVYYVNKVTKARQWKHPAMDTDQSAAASDLSTSDSLAEIQPIDKSFKRLDLSSMETIISKREASKSLEIKLDDRCDRVDKLRRYIDAIKHEETISGQRTMSYLDGVGRLKKSGYLMKQSKLLGRWKKRYFVLDAGVLAYFDSPQDADLLSDSKLNEGKVFPLQANSAVSYTAKEFCFLLKGEQDDTNRSVVAVGPDDWCLTAETDRDMEEWITAITAHILVQYKIERKVDSDFFDVGRIETSFWRVPASSSGINRLPVGIRTLPYLDSPRTLEGIYPGEIIEVVQDFDCDENTFLRLADDRGWVYRKHWKVQYELLQRAPGEFLEVNRDVEVDKTSDAHKFVVFSGPSVSSTVVDVALEPGARVAISATFTSVEDTLAMTFGKLYPHRGWIVL